MKRNYIFVVLLVLIGFGIFFWLHLQPKTNSSSLSAMDTNSSSPQLSRLPGTTAQPQTTTATITSKQAALDPAVVEYVKNIKADPQYDWKQPLNLYGIIIDQSNSPVADASIHFVWTDLSVTGTSEADTKSDGNGFFSLTDKHGKRLSVSIDKSGYYGARASFEYANPADGLFKPDPNNPYIFHLRKKGPGADLIMSQNGMSTFITIRPPTNGAPVFFDLLNPKVTDNGQLKIEGWKELKNHTTGQNDWGLRLTVSDGGLIEENDEFPFEAPEEGYQSVIEWHFTNGSPDWQGGINKRFYIKFGNPPRYGRITVQTGAFRPAVDLEYAINPDGSRYLEPK